MLSSYTLTLNARQLIHAISLHQVIPHLFAMGITRDGSDCLYQGACSVLIPRDYDILLDQSHPALAHSEVLLVAECISDRVIKTAGTS